MTSCRQNELPVLAGHDAPNSQNDYLRDAVTLLQQMVAELEPLAELKGTMATAIEAMQRDIEALISIVEFIPTVSEDSPCVNELNQLANTRIARLTAELEQIAHQAESLMLDFHARE